MSPIIRISLLSALPHSREDVDRARGDPRKDYVRNNLGGLSKTTEEIWAAMGPSLEVEAKRLFDLCEDLGVFVVRNAGVKQLTAAAARSDVVIVLAHWKGPYVEIDPPDILAPAADLKDCVEHCISKGIIQENVRDEVLGSASEGLARDNLADKLNEAIDNLLAQKLVGFM